MKRQTTLGWVFALLAVVILVPALVSRVASAAQLPVTASPVQTWTADLPVFPAAVVVSQVVASVAPAQSDGPDDAARPDGEGDPVTSGGPGQPDPSAGPGNAGGPDATPDVDLTECGDLDDYDEVVYGTRHDDELTAKAGRKILVGLRGDDVLRGGDGDDCLIGGNGDDELTGGAGDDYLDGGNGHDVLDAGLDPGDVCADTESDELVACGPIEEAAPVDDVVESEPSPEAPRGDDAPASGIASPAPDPGSSAGNDSATDRPSETPAPEGTGPLDTVAESGEALEDALTGE
jgi:hypothetical protein